MQKYSAFLMLYSSSLVINMMLSSQFRRLASPSVSAFNMRFFGQIVGIKLPDLGEGTKEATIKEWFVKEGDKVDEVGSWFILSLVRRSV
jgi:hypothetical protein